MRNLSRVEWSDFSMMSNNNLQGGRDGVGGKQQMFVKKINLKKITNCSPQSGSSDCHSLMKTLVTNAKPHLLPSGFTQHPVS